MRSNRSAVCLVLLLICGVADAACTNADLAGYWEGTATTTGNGVSIAPTAVRLKLDLSDNGTVKTDTSFATVLAPSTGEDDRIHIVPGSYLAVFRPDDCRIAGVFYFYERPGYHYHIIASMNPSRTMMVGIVRTFDAQGTFLDSATFTNMKM